MSRIAAGHDGIAAGRRRLAADAIRIAAGPDRLAADKDRMDAGRANFAAAAVGFVAEAGGESGMRGAEADGTARTSTTSASIPNDAAADARWAAEAADLDAVIRPRGAALHAQLDDALATATFIEARGDEVLSEEIRALVAAVTTRSTSPSARDRPGRPPR